MLLTVAVCTWNRAARLDTTLSGLERLRVPGGAAWEVLVVDNGSTDDTPAVCKRHADQLPVRWVFEAQPGIGAARNRAVAEAGGRYILWTDDDATVATDWAEKLLEAFDRFGADLVFGRVDPVWEAGHPPGWYTPAFAGMFALLDLGGPPRIITDPWAVGFNVNMAFRRELPAKVGKYRTDVGAGEDSDLCLRAHKAGAVVAYQPEAVVHHHIPAARCTKRFSRLYAWRGSPHHLRLLRDEGRAVPRLLGLPRYFVRKQAEHLAGLLSADPRERFYHELKLIRLAGLLYAQAAGWVPMHAGEKIRHLSGER